MINRVINRAKVVDENFTRNVRAGQLPRNKGSARLSGSGLSPAQLVDLFESQVISRHADLQARALRAKGEGYYTIGSSGHEGNAAVAAAAQVSDPAFLHYRSGAFFVQRSKQLPGSTPIYDLMLSLAASSDDPISGGRHKVFGSRELAIPPQTSTIASHLPKAVGMAFSIARAKSLGVAGEAPDESVVLCSFGDASINHSTAQGALNLANWLSHLKLPLPLVWVCEDNGIGISVPTPKAWVEQNFGPRDCPRYYSADGLNLIEIYQTARQAIHYARELKRPAFLHLKTIRLLGHAGSDVESGYRDLKVIEEIEAHDPLLYSAGLVLSEGGLSGDEVLNIYESVRLRMDHVADQAILRPRLQTAEEVMSSITVDERYWQPEMSAIDPATPERLEIFGNEARLLDEPQPLGKQINFALTDLMLQYPHSVVFGEDVARKGGVYHVTANLQKRFGQKRVFDSLLDEQSILGVAIGMAQNGFLPVPEIQFLAYYHNAEDQIRGEAATLSFFSQGQYQNPMVVRIAGLAYQKGFGGHFHNDNSIAAMRDLPGVILACPARGEDAVGMLKECFRLAHVERRVVLFLEPIALYMTRDLIEKGDQGWCEKYPGPEAPAVRYGEVGITGKSGRLTILSYANGCFLSHQVLHDLRKKGVKELPKVVDLRWLSPLPMDAIMDEVRDCESILIVDECRRSGSLSEELMARLWEMGWRGKRLERITAEDCFIPLGQRATITLPSREQILDRVLDILDE